MDQKGHALNIRSFASFYRTVSLKIYVKPEFWRFFKMKNFLKLVNLAKVRHPPPPYIQGRKLFLFPPINPICIYGRYPSPAYLYPYPNPNFNRNPSFQKM